MTESGDSLTELADQVKILAGQLARAQGDIGTLRAKLEANAGLETTLRLEIKKLGRRITAAENRKAEGPSASWWVVDQAEGQVMMAELSGWLETFLRRHYPGYAARLAPCVLNHYEAVWELSTLRAEWERIYVADEDNQDLQGALAWHDRYLPGVLRRLSESIKCDAAGCLLTRSRYQA